MPSLVQWMLLASPHSGFRCAFTLVFWLQDPIGPDHASGGCRQELRMMADVLASSESEMPLSSKGGLMLSSPCQRRSTLPVVESHCEIALPPSACSVK